MVEGKTDKTYTEIVEGLKKMHDEIEKTEGKLHIGKPQIGCIIFFIGLSELLTGSLIIGIPLFLIGGYLIAN
jgi:hypothetical protein